jgi:hypothetical protein
MAAIFPRQENFHEHGARHETEGSCHGEGVLYIKVSLRNESTHRRVLRVTFTYAIHTGFEIAGLAPEGPDPALLREAHNKTAIMENQKGQDIRSRLLPRLLE